MYDKKERKKGEGQGESIKILQLGLEFLQATKKVDNSKNIKEF